MLHPQLLNASHDAKQPPLGTQIVLIAYEEYSLPFGQDIGF
jgi:hypothetical protein